MDLVVLSIIKVEVSRTPGSVSIGIRPRLILSQQRQYEIRRNCLYIMGVIISLMRQGYIQAQTTANITHKSLTNITLKQDASSNA